MSEIDIKKGGMFTIAGLYKMVPNPNRRWWQLWKPKRVQSIELQTWKVITKAS
ncbi:hypothetical protein IC614_03010 [Allosphingosinicella flava]|uniref:Uncharacterized protein n=1 Tax=Allosphingosinicella flava TaxID=2771430 RepID=A0A7T2LMI4_9SPHN|nr:hypothetical protein [Sphingosinicella flava]QPQ55586.1 hypothetical protein IC614_03010 [Sphingosinicella flava]